VAARPTTISTCNFFAHLGTFEVDTDTTAGNEAGSGPPHPATAKTRTKWDRKVTSHHPYHFGQPAEVSGGNQKFHELYLRIQNHQERDQGLTKEIADYSPIMRHIDTLEIPYYNFHSKSMDPVKVVIRHLPEN
jgi:hypothetical protein